MMTSTTAVSDERPAITLLWRIKNFSYWLPSSIDPVIRSPAFRIASLEKRCLYLELNPRGKSVSDKRMSLNLQMSQLKCSYTVDCEWSFLDSKGLALKSETLKKITISSREGIDWHNCPTRSEVVTKRSSFLIRDTLVIRCRLWKSDEDLEQAEHISAVTRINVEKHYLLWPIPGFSNIKLKEKVENTYVKLDRDPVQKVGCSLVGDSLEDSTIEVEITLGSYVPFYSMTVELSALDDKQKSLKSVKRISSVALGTKKISNFSNFLSRKELVDNMSDYLRNDVLTLHFVFSYCARSHSANIKGTYFGPSNLKEDIPRSLPSFTEASCQTLPRIIDLPDTSYEQEINSATVLRDELLNLYQDQTLSDFELKAGDTTFPVHKNILSARSPVFKAMFTGDMKESGSRSLDVPDLDSHTLGRLLTFLYAGTVDGLEWEGAARLYYAADKYQIPTLKQECSSVLRSGTSVSNVSEVLELADRHRDEGLTSFLHDFILSRFVEVMRSDEWEQFLDRDSLLAGKTTLQLCKKRF